MKLLIAALLLTSTALAQTDPADLPHIRATVEVIPYQVGDPEPDDPTFFTVAGWVTGDNLSFFDGRSILYTAEMQTGLWWMRWRKT